MNADAVSERYRGEKGRQYHAGKRGVPAGTEMWVARARARMFQPQVGEGDTVFEFGVGLGWNLAALRCGRRLGFDVAESEADRVRALGIEWVADLRQLEDAVVDVLICHHTLEHVGDPLGALASWRRLIRPGGRLLLGVPWERERRYRRFVRGEPNHHLFTWNAQNLGNLVEVAGYDVGRVEVKRYGYDRFAAVQAWRWRLGEKGYRWLRGALQCIRPCWEVRLQARLTGG